MISAPSAITRCRAVGKVIRKLLTSEGHVEIHKNRNDFYSARRLALDCDQHKIIYNIFKWYTSKLKIGIPLNGHSAYHITLVKCSGEVKG